MGMSGQAGGGAPFFGRGARISRACVTIFRRGAPGGTGEAGGQAFPRISKRFPSFSKENPNFSKLFPRKCKEIP
jgi:hypothetical protein